jgi:hypothetical protein
MCILVWSHLRHLFCSQALDATGNIYWGINSLGFANNWLQALLNRPIAAGINIGLK